MDDAFLVWMLSTLPSLGTALAAIAHIGFVLSAILWVIPLVENNVRDETERVLYTTVKILAPVSFACFLAGWSLPDDEDLVKSYLMVAGAQGKLRKVSDEDIKEIEEILDSINKICTQQR